MSDSPQISRHDELLIDSVLFGLDGVEAEEFTKLIDQQNHDNDSSQPKVSYEMAAAALDMSLLKIESMPSALAKNILNQGRAFCANLSAGQVSDLPNSDSSPQNDLSTTPEEVLAKESTGSTKSFFDKPVVASESRWTTADDLENTFADKGVSPREILSWATAAAIAFVAYFVWSTSESESRVAEVKLGDLQSENQLLLRNLTTAERIASDLKEAQTETIKKLNIIETQANYANIELKKLQKKLSPDGEEIYRQVAQSEDSIKWAWEDNSGEGVTGDVVWDTDKQLGSMKISGLPKNDPSTEQYQLWIIEESGREHPVDGGVFDINQDGVVFVVMQPKLLTTKPKQFAITIEKPGGVVVSKLEKLPLLAKAPTED